MLTEAQLEDPGKLVQFGYSAGSRSALKFDWVRNLLSHKHPAEVISAMEMRGSAAFALVWNMVRVRLPASIIADFDAFLHTTLLCGMDAKGNVGQNKGDRIYEVQVGPETFSFHAAKLAPPMGVVAHNYSRCGSQIERHVCEDWG